MIDNGEAVGAVHEIRRQRRLDANYRRKGAEAHTGPAGPKTSAPTSAVVFCVLANKIYRS